MLELIVGVIIREPHNKKPRKKTIGVVLSTFLENIVNVYCMTISIRSTFPYFIFMP